MSKAKTPTKKAGSKKTKKVVFLEPRDSWQIKPDGEMETLNKDSKPNLENRTAWLVRGHMGAFEFLEQAIGEETSEGIIAIHSEIEGLDWLFCNHIDQEGEVAIAPFPVEEAKTYAWLVFLTSSQSKKFQEYFVDKGYEVQKAENIKLKNNFTEQQISLYTFGCKAKPLIFRDKTPRRFLKIRAAHTPIPAVYPAHAQYWIEETIELQNLNWPLSPDQVKYVNKQIKEQG